MPPPRNTNPAALISHAKGPPKMPVSSVAPPTTAVTIPAVLSDREPLNARPPRARTAPTTMLNNPPPASTRSTTPPATAPTPFTPCLVSTLLGTMSLIYFLRLSFNVTEQGTKVSRAPAPLRVDTARANPLEYRHASPDEADRPSGLIVLARHRFV